MSFSFSHKLSESTKATDILHHYHLMTVAVLVREIEEIGGPKGRQEKRKNMSIHPKRELVCGAMIYTIQSKCSGNCCYPHVQRREKKEEIMFVKGQKTIT